MSLSSYRVSASIAVADLSEAARFYEGKLGLQPGPEQSDQSRIYPCAGGTVLHVYVSPTPTARGAGTVATWYVPDLDRLVDDLGRAGVAFERYDDPALKVDERGFTNSTMAGSRGSATPTAIRSRSRKGIEDVAAGAVGALPLCAKPRDALRSAFGFGGKLRIGRH